MKGIKNKVKYFKCVSCKAVVKEVVPCNCRDCGITCCGEKMVEIPEKEVKKTKILTCSSCGAKYEVVEDCTCKDCAFTCCNKEMKVTEK